MRKLLLVSPHFAPVNTPDSHRVRALLPYFQINGWQVEVLAVCSRQVAAPVDDWLSDGLPPDVPIHRVDALSLAWSRVPGLGTLGLRALQALAREGENLLENGGFDLVFFSTTVFEVHLLGPRWKRKFGVPFVMDYQDPWVNDYYRNHPDVIPPGGRVKYAITDVIHRQMEPRVLRDCAGLLSVSTDYPRQIAARYPMLTQPPALVQSFPGANYDFERANDSRVSQSFFDPADDCIHWVYAGVLVPGMLPTIRALFVAIVEVMPRDDFDRLRLHFIGTSYAKGGSAKPQVSELAREFGLEEIVHERCDRVPYSTVIACLRDADALLAFGSDDPSYTASKILPYLLARKPLLALFSDQSSVVDILGRVGGAVCVSFGTQLDGAALADAIGQSWLSSRNYSVVLPLDPVALEPHTARGCAAELSDFFRKCLTDASN